MTIRVRAIVQPTPETLVVIKRTKPLQPPYFVLPGGGVEPTDRSLPEALQRELWEELGHDATVVSCRPIVRLDDSTFGTQIIYLAHLAETFTGVGKPSGPEFFEPGRGDYEHQIRSLDELDSLEVKPTELLNSLVDCYRLYGSLEVLPHLEPRLLPTLPMTHGGSKRASTSRI